MIHTRALAVTAPHGGVLEVEVAGGDDGATLIFHHGTPGIAGTWEPFARLGAERGLRHVSYSRPGYAGSDRHAGRTVADVAADVAAIADALGVERFHTAGASGGGPHALATAALLGDRVISAATIAAVAPADADGLDWTAGMGEENVAEFAAARQGEQDLRGFIAEQAEHFRGLTGEQVADGLGNLVGEADRRALTGAYAAWSADRLDRSLSNLDGWLDDDLAILSPWGFDLDAITVPLTIWQGDDDRFVPFAHGQWLAARLPNADARLLEGHGHLSIAVGGYDRVLDALLASARTPGL
jgi:pimeloyl-ACP methyl ester carboxylesterase